MLNITQYILLLVLFPFSLFAQTENNIDSINYYRANKTNFHVTILLLVLFPFSLFAQTENNIDSINVGTSFTSFSGYGSGISSFAMPTMDYQINNKFGINAGLMMINNNMNSVPYYFSSENANNTFSGNVNHSIFFASGTFQLSKKLTVSGSAFKQISNNGNMEKVNPQAFNFDSKGVSIGLKYQLSKNASFGAEIHMIKGFTPYSPYQTLFPLSEQYW